MKYFFLAGVKDAGKTTCLIKIDSFLRTIGYKSIYSKIFSNDIIVLLEKGNKRVLINTASDPECDQKLIQFIKEVQNKELWHEDIIVISALRANTGGTNYRLRVTFEKILGVKRDTSIVAEIEMEDSKNCHPSLFDATKNEYCTKIYEACINILTKPTLPFQL